MKKKKITFLLTLSVKALMDMSAKNVSPAFFLENQFIYFQNIISSSLRVWFDFFYTLYKYFGSHKLHLF